MPDDISKAARAIGRLGGQSKSAAKAAAARANGRKAAEVAKQRGNAVGRPKKNRSAAIDTAQKDSVA